jgi:hypothetical protein
VSMKLHGRSTQPPATTGVSNVGVSGLWRGLGLAEGASSSALSYELQPSESEERRGATAMKKLRIATIRFGTGNGP